MTMQNVETLTPSRPRWTIKDTVWMMGVYGATVGAGTLFLPVEIGTLGPIVFIMMLLLGLPLSVIPHVLICRVFMRDNQTADKSLPLFGAYFGAKGKQAIKMFFCTAHFPITLVYGISLVSTINDYYSNHLHLGTLNRGALVFVVLGLLFLMLSKGREKVVNTLSVLAIPFALTILLIAIIQIPAWDISTFLRQLSATRHAPAGETLKNLWLTLPLITFAFCSTPMISPLASWYRQAGNGGEKQSVFVVRAAYGLIFVSIVFFVLSCVLSYPHETFVRAKADNLNIMSIMQGKGGFSLLALIAPFIALIGMTKSFLGISLPVAETLTTLTADAIRATDAAGQRKARRIAFALLFGLSYAIVYLNPNVIGLIETVCGPLIAIFLFVIPAYLIYTREALRPLRGAKAIIVIMGGLLTVSALLYSAI